jgi:hypothetical protein
VAVHFKSFVQILMAVLALGIYIHIPEPACAAGTSEVGKTCCCTGSPVCKCHPDKPCKQSCTLVKVRAPLDKQLPTRSLATASHGLVPLFAITLSKVTYAPIVPVVAKRAIDTSPPLRGDSPQAVLRVWLI